MGKVFLKAMCSNFFRKQLYRGILSSSVAKITTVWYVDAKFQRLIMRFKSYLEEVIEIVIYQNKQYGIHTLLLKK